MFCFCVAFIEINIFSEQQQKTSKYWVSDTCQNNELNSLSRHSCYLLALVADYDGSTLVSEIILMLVMAIIITLTTTGMRMNPKNSGSFFIVYKTAPLHPFLLPHRTEYLLSMFCALGLQASTSHLIIKQGVVL